MGFSADQSYVVTLDQYGDAHQRTSKGASDYFTYVATDLVKIRTHGLNYGDVRLYTLSASGEGKVFILDVPAETVYFRDETDNYRMCPATVTYHTENGWIASIAFDPEESGVLNRLDKRDAYDEILETNMWTEAHEHVKAYLIITNLEELI